MLTPREERTFILKPLSKCITKRTKFGSSSHMSFRSEKKYKIMYKLNIIPYNKHLILLL